MTHFPMRPNPLTPTLGRLQIVLAVYRPKTAKITFLCICQRLKIMSNRERKKIITDSITRTKKKKQYFRSEYASQQNKCGFI